MKNVHEELSRLAQWAIIFYEEDDQIDILPALKRGFLRG